MNHGKEHYHAATHGKKVHEQTADTKNHPQHQIEENQEPRSGFQLGQVNRIFKITYSPFNRFVASKLFRQQRVWEITRLLSYHRSTTRIKISRI